MTQADFWTRRKAAVRAEAEAAQPPAAPTPEAPPLDDELDDQTVLEQLGLPDPDSLGAGDDFAGFMAKAVPEHLRRRALRRLWVSNPVLANVDGLVDYAEDFTDAATVLPGMQTAYQVGKGMARHVEALLADAPEEDAMPTPEAEPDVEAPDVVAQPAPMRTNSAEGADLLPVEAADDLPSDPAPRLRHMRFEIS